MQEWVVTKCHSTSQGSRCDTHCPMGLEIGLLCEEYVGCECKSIRSVSRAKAPTMEKAYPKNPIVVILDNARIQELEDRGW